MHDSNILYSPIFNKALPGEAEKNIIIPPEGTM